MMFLGRMFTIKVTQGHWLPTFWTAHKGAGPSTEMSVKRGRRFEHVPRCCPKMIMLSPFLFHSLNDAYPPSTLGRRRDSIETLGCPTLHGACDYRLEASLATFIPNPT
ncbi:hypothetical protein TNCV_187991 [Trichonephila clavipes]|nr:hypothetical protein TNCV_187991 [Trichonephila clavipes]